MTGKYDVVLYNNKLHYHLTINRNITILRGYSASGKSELIRLLSAHNGNPASSGITLVCDRKCIVLTEENWKLYSCTYPEKLKEYQGRSARMIVSPGSCKSIVYDLTKLCEKYDVNVLCIVPVFPFFVTKEKIYNINKFLAYFRNRLFRGTIPTIVSYECSGGLVYDMMDWLPLTPMVNTTYTYEDYLKICLNPQKYLSSDLKNVHWGVFYNFNNSKKEFPCAELQDITVCFPHDNDCDGIAEKWQIYRRNINWNLLLYLMVRREQNIPIHVIKEFSK